MRIEIDLKANNFIASDLPTICVINNDEAGFIHKISGVEALSSANDKTFTIRATVFEQNNNNAVHQKSYA